MVNCRNPLCKTSLVGATGVALRAGPFFMGHFCTTCADKISTGAKIGMHAAGMAAIAWAQQKHPDVLKVFQDVLTLRRMEGPKS